MDPRTGGAAALLPETMEIAATLREGVAVPGLLASVSPARVIEALEEALAAYRAAAPGEDAERLRDCLLSLMDAGRWPAFLRRLSETPDAARWLDAVLRAIDAADVGLGDLLRLRSRQQPDRPIVRVPAGREMRDVTRAELAERVDAIAAGLAGELPDPPGRVSVAILAPNRLETTLVDLACLTHGIVDVPIPIDATPDQVRLILEQTGASILVVADEERLAAAMSGGPPPDLRRIVLIDPPEDGGDDDRGRVPLAQLEERGRAAGRVARPRASSRDLATVMFTSGTTGRPKGIRFSQRNIVYKRFCRAVALPEIGEDDVFLCYLPLFHTFGRWLEMTGCLFWGSCYAALENPSIEAMLAGMRRHRPSVFISIPKRWIQLHERIVLAAGGAGDDPLGPEPARLREAVAAVTGGRLRWGLSAAGHLDSDVFVFFQRHGVELISGFGMTEATGGITMTPPGRYRRGTVGVALPGIEVRRGEDGELLCRGPYMMLGYDDAEEPERDHEREWFGSGDLVEQDADGYYTIVDRKKDIYKNVKGQTISPQRIENMFTEFEEIKRVFLVGDGREYNTILIYPDYDAAGGKLARMSRDEVREYLSSFVVSVNRFLAPFERVVDFDLLPRYFREDRGELTPKGTFVRKVVEKNFADLIDALYARAFVTLRVEGLDVRVPTWLLREKGLTADALVAEPGGIRLRPTGERLAVTRAGGATGRFRVGSFTYALEPDEERGGPAAAIDLDPLLRVPRYWVGNAELAAFAGEGLIRRPRRGTEADPRITVEGWQRSVLLLDRARERFVTARRQEERGATGVHAAAALLLCAQGDEALEAFGVLTRFLADPTSDEAGLVRAILPLLRWHADASVRRRALALALPLEVDERAAETLRGFLAVDAEALTEDVAAALLAVDIPAAAMRSLLDLARDLEVGGDAWTLPVTRARVATCLRFVAETGAKQPRWYAAARQVLVRRALTERDADVARLAAAERRRLDERFRLWIASGVTQPADPETGQPVPWERVAGFDERIEAGVRERLLRALGETTLLRETVFLLAEETLLGGGEMLPGGIWVSDMGSADGHAAVRFTVRTRAGRSHEFFARVTPAADAGAAEEVDWLIRLGTAERGRRLVADFGGFWPENGIWTEEYIADETVAKQIRRVTAAGDPDAIARLVALWPHFAWSALTAFVDFWQRTGGRIVPAGASADAIAVAPHDYQEGSRLVSLAARKPFEGLAAMVRFLYERFVVATEETYPILAGGAPRRIAFHAVIESLGEAAAEPLLHRALAEMREQARGGRDPLWRSWAEDLSATIDEVERDGYAPRRLVMAVRRFHTWAGLNPGAAMQARAMMLQELYETYDLPGLEAAHPGLRVRFFRMTVFADARLPLAVELDAMIRAHRDVPLSLEALLRRMTVLSQTFPLDEEETYFLARMTYSHLRPAQRVRLELLEAGGGRKAELVEEIANDEGAPLRIRAAASPKEVMRLHRLFEHSGLAVVFRPEHAFLVVVDEDDAVVGGLFYRPAGTATAHMEKIVVGPRQRGKGVGEKLMESFLQRMRDAGLQSVTTGFFRPHYFYRFGFRLEKGFAGLVRDLAEPGATEAGA